MAPRHWHSIEALGLGSSDRVDNNGFLAASWQWDGEARCARPSHILAPMCRYAGMHYKTHYVCLSCRVTFKHDFDPERERPCPRCRRAMVDAGRDFAAPRRADRAGWRALAAVLNAGLDFHSCGCGGPGFRPRTPAQVRVRLDVAGQTGTPAREALTLRDPDEGRAP
jgi:hypothetical protein